MKRNLALCVLLTIAATRAVSAQPYPTSWDPALMQRADVKAAMTRLEQQFPQQVEEWI